MTQPTKKRTWRKIYLFGGFILFGQVILIIENWDSLYPLPHPDPLTLAKATSLYTKSTEQGNAITQYNFGNMCYNGKGVQRDYEKALEWYTKSAEQGYTKSQNILGLMYYNGDAVPKDDKQAAHWWLKAAKQGHTWAQHNLGELYYNTKSNLQDDKKAYMWYSITSHNGWVIAQKDRDKMAKKLSFLDLIKAKKMTRRCLKSGYKDC